VEVGAVEGVAIGFVETVVFPSKIQERSLGGDFEAQHLQGPCLRRPPHLLCRWGGSDCCLGPRERSCFRSERGLQGVGERWRDTKGKR
jgi:hypothetical protein